MKTATFTRCVDPADHGVVVGWLGGNYDETTVNNSAFGSPTCCIVAKVTTDFTQQEMDDLTANAAARFMLVAFS